MGKRELIVYYDSLNGLGALRLTVDDRDSVYDCFHAEAAHRHIPVPSYLGSEPIEDARTASVGRKVSFRAFVHERAQAMMRRGMIKAPKELVDAINDIAPDCTPFMEALRTTMTGPMRVKVDPAVPGTDTTVVATVHDETIYARSVPGEWVEPEKPHLPPEVHIEDKSIDVERAWRATRDLCR